MIKDDYYFMGRALMQAKTAFRHGEVPVGAVVVKDGKVISRGYNRRESDRDPTAHAELIAMRRAAKKLNSWRLTGCTLYVTLEPCPMCTGAIINSRIKRLVYGASDYKAGSCGSGVDLFSLPYNHKPEVVSGVMQEECAALLTDFFKKLRKK